MVMVDGVNVIAASQESGSDGGQNPHEGGLVAIMTGVPALGKIGQQDHSAGGPSIDQLLLAQSPVLGGPTQAKPTKFGSLQLAADIRSDRDEVAPRVLSYLPPHAGQTDTGMARKPLYPEPQPLNVFNRVFGGSLPTGTNSAQLLAQKKSVLDCMRSDLARMQTLVPSSERDRLVAHSDAIAQLEASIKTMYSTMTGTPVCSKPSMPMNYAATASGQMQTSTIYTKQSGVDYYAPGTPPPHPPLDPGTHP